MENNFKPGDIVNAKCNFFSCKAEIVEAMPALLAGDTSTYYKIKPLESPYKRYRPITELVTKA